MGSQLKEVEQAMEEAAEVANNVINCINKNLHTTNLISETTPGFLLEAQQLQTRWKQIVEEKTESIKQINKLNWDTYWQYLVKPHSQWMTMKFLITPAKKIVLTLANSVLVGQLKSEVGQPTLLKLMLDICNLKEQMHDLA